MSNPDDTSHSPQPGQVTPQGGSNSSPPTVSARWVPPTPLELQEQLPQYKVLEMIGHGGMGAVFKGWQVSLERYVAIKILPPNIQEDGENFAMRFQQEARTMAKMTHPGIVSVYDAGQTAQGWLYFVMEFVEGEDVSQLLKRKGSLSSEYALAITAHVCDALHYAHTHGVVHRDIKPANVMLNSEGVVKVADFGLAKASGATSSGLTKSNISMGTPDYIAPEALVMGMFADHRADIYALGVMLYQMLTGKIPRGMCAPPSQRKPGVDPRFDPIVIRAMKEERDERYQSVADMRRALDVILTSPHVEEAPAAAEPAPQVSAKPETRKPKPSAAPKAGVRTGAPKKAGAGMMAGVIGGVVALALVGWGVFKPKPKPDPAAEHTEQNGTSSVGTQPTPQSTSARQTLDLLALVDVAKDSVSGDWSRRADGVAVKTSDEVRLQLPYMPPQEYDFIIDFTVTQGSPDVRQILCVNGHDFLWRMGVNHNPKAPDWFGFEQVNGKYFVSNGNKTKTITPWKLETGVRNTAMLAVRKDGVTATVNGKQVTDFKTDFKNVGIQDGFKLKDPRLLGFGASNCDVTFHRAEVREITGKGTLTRSAPSLTGGSTPPTNVPSGQGASVATSTAALTGIDLLASVDVKRDAISGDWSRKGADLLQFRQIDTSLLEFTNAVPDEYDFEIEFTPMDGISCISQILTANGRNFSWRVGLDTQAKDFPCEFDWLGGKLPADASRASASLGKPLEKGKRHRSTVEVRKGSVRGLLDGVELVKWSGDLNRLKLRDASPFRDPRHLGIGSYRRSVVFHRVTLRPAGESAGGGK